MSNIAISFENVGKMYRLGRVGTGTLSHDLNRWWTTAILHKEDPYLKIGETNDRSKKGSSDYVWALRDISFKVEQGDVVGIIGKNGAGKSTLLKLLSRITSPTTGSICYQGRIASLLEVGTGFHPEMTGRENIYMNGSIMGMTKKEITRKLDEIVDFAGVERYLDTPVKRYSSGMTVRLGFAVAAFLEPEILVVDEVLTVGDAEFQKKAIGKMKDVSQGSGRTVLFVSHNMASVRTLCNQGVVLKNGCVDYIGTADKCVDYYTEQSLMGGDSFDFANRKTSHKRAFISDFAFLDAQGNISSSFSFSDVLSCKLKVKSNEDFNITARITLFDVNHSRIMAFDSQDVSSVFSIKEEKETTLYCYIKEPLNIKSGRFSVNVSIRQGNELLDHIENVSYIDVKEEDFYGYGRYSVGDMPICLRHHTWEMQ
jgi:ABC-type polysaccharide/polyol phosphate transport system ATPase subunit